MKTYLYPVTGILFTALLLIGIAWLWTGGGDRDDRDAENAAQVYVSSEYGFSFEYPANAVVEAYTPVSLAIDKNAAGDFDDADAEVMIVTSGEDGGYESYDEFVFERTITMCAADGPDETIYCDELQDESMPFTTTSGLSGEMFSLRRVHENFTTGETDTDVFGPIFVFDISANLPELRYAALVVRPPVTDEGSKIDEELVRSIALSVQIETNEPAGQAELGLVTDVSTTGDTTTVTVDFVAWLEGEAAMAAAVADTGCTAGTIDECVPTMTNNFYIRNVETDAETFPVAADARLVLLAGTSPVTGTITDIADAVMSTNGSLLAAVEIEDGTVVRIEQVFTP